MRRSGNGSNRGLRREQAQAAAVPARQCGSLNAMEVLTAKVLRIVIECGGINQRTRRDHRGLSRQENPRPYD